MDGQALWAAVLEDPADDSVRLVYADWLADNGQEARAEFIRVQVERARLPDDDPAAEALPQRQAALSLAHGPAWRAERPPIPGAFLRPFVRGFVEEATFSDAGAFLAAADALFAAVPLTRLRLTRLDDDQAEALAKERRLARLRDLIVQGGKLSPAGARRLAGSPHLAGLSLLSLTDTTIGDQGAEALAGPPPPGRLGS